MKIVIFGASGDLAKRKLFPSLSTLSPTLQIIAYSRSILTSTHLNEFYTYTPDFLKQITFISGPYDNIQLPIEKYIFYFSIPPKIYKTLLNSITAYKESIVCIEKPFGYSMESFLSITQFEINNPSFRVCLIDHYLLKPLSLVLNNIKKSLLIGRSVREIDFLSKEELGIEGRAYFDEAGIVRDVLQNHLIVLYNSLLIKEDTPDNTSFDKINNTSFEENGNTNFEKHDTSFEKNNIGFEKNNISFDENNISFEENNISFEEKLKSRGLMRAHILKNSALIDEQKFGQYEGYESELGKKSNTITYASLHMHNLLPEYSGIKFNFMAGKGMDEKRTEIRVKYRKEYFKEVIDYTLNRTREEGHVSDGCHKTCDNPDFYNRETLNLSQLTVSTLNDIYVNKEQIKSVYLIINYAPHNEVYLKVRVDHTTRKYIIYSKSTIKKMVLERFGKNDDYAFIFDGLLNNKNIPLTHLDEALLQWKIFGSLNTENVFKYKKGLTMGEEDEDSE